MLFRSRRRRRPEVKVAVREIKKTVCNRDCPDVCGIVATVEDGRVTRIAGDPDHPVTHGFLCYRTQHFLARQYAPDSGEINRVKAIIKGMPDLPKPKPQTQQGQAQGGTGAPVQTSGNPADPSRARPSRP